MTYPFADCCPNLPGAGDEFSPCDDGWCCTHETCHGCGDAECEGDHDAPAAVGGHRFLPGGDDATFGAAGAWCAVWIRTADGPDQCGRSAEVHPPDGAGAVSLAEAMKKATEDPSYGVARLECAPGVVGFLRALAPDEPPASPWRPAPIVPLGSVPVVGDDTLPAGRWRMVDRDGGVVWEGTLEQ